MRKKLQKFIRFIILIEAQKNRHIGKSQTIYLRNNVVENKDNTSSSFIVTYTLLGNLGPQPKGLRCGNIKHVDTVKNVLFMALLAEPVEGLIICKSLFESRENYNQESIQTLCILWTVAML